MNPNLMPDNSQPDEPSVNNAPLNSSGQQFDANTPIQVPARPPANTFSDIVMPGQNLQPGTASVTPATNYSPPAKPEIPNSMPNFPANNITAPTADSAAFTPQTTNLPNNDNEPIQSYQQPGIINAQSSPTNSPPNPQPVATVFQGSPVAQTNQPSPFEVKKPKRKFGKLKLVLAILAVLAVLGGASSAAYFGYILPNKPANKLLDAIANSVGQSQVTLKGQINVHIKQAAGGKLNSFDINYTLATDLNQHNLSLDGSLGVYGLQFPFNARYIDKNVYFKIGGLNSVSKLSPFVQNPLAKGYLNAVAAVNDQWYVIDSSLLDSSQVSSCVSSVSWALNKNDVNAIKQAYKQHPLFDIKGISSATIDGDKTTKYELDPTSDTQASAFFSQLSNVSVASNIGKCMNSTSSKGGDQALNSITNNNTVAKFFVYVGSDKKIKNIEADVSDNTSVQKVTASFDYGVVKIDKPTGAKTAQDLLGDFFGPLYSNTAARPKSPALQ